MKAPSLFTLHQVLLCQASLVQYARFVSAANLTSTLITPTPTRQNSSIQCTACAVSVLQEILTYPGSVSTETQNITATVIPHITQYDNGTEVTSLETITYTAPNATSQTFVFPSTTAITWKIYSTTLTYPTSYLAFPSPFAGYYSSVEFGNSSYCDYNPTQVPIPTASISKLIFPFKPSQDNFDAITSKALSYIDSLPTVTAILGGKDPYACSQVVGVPSAAKLTGTSIQPLPPGPTSVSVAGSMPQAVIHTSVAVLTTTGQAVITKATAEPQHSGSDDGDDSDGGHGSSTDDNSGSGSDNGGSGSNNGGSGSNNGGSGSTSGSGSDGGLAGLVNSAIVQWQSTQPAAIQANPTSQMVNVGSSSVPVAHGQSGTVVIAGVTLAPGASTVVNGVTVSNPSGGSGVIIGGSSVKVTATAGSGSSSGSKGSPVMTVGGSTITAGASGAFIVGSQTLTPGGTIVVSGTTYSLGPSGSMVVVNGQTKTLSGASGTSSDTSTTSTSASSGIGGAIASGIGISTAPASQTGNSGAQSGNTVSLLGALIGLSVGIVGVLV